MRIRQGDEVVIIAGKDRGKRGKVRIAIPSRERLIVEGANVVRKHQKGRPGVAQAGIIDKEAPLHISNVMLYCPNCNKPTRVGVNRDEKHHQQRYCRRCNESVDRL